MNEVICQNCGASYSTSSNKIPKFECICNNKNFELKQGKNEE